MCVHACTSVDAALWLSLSLSKHFCVSPPLPFSVSAPLVSLCAFLSGSLFVLLWASFPICVFLLTVLLLFPCLLSLTHRELCEGKDSLISLCLHIVGA